jgi:uroporphyrinogen-III synthase
VRSASDPSAVLAQWRAGAIDIAVVTSVESLHALADLLGDEGRALMRATPAVVMSRRVAEAARGTVSEALVAEDMSDAGIVEAIARWRLRTADRPPPT